ncbi:ATP-binding cassette sub-family G member 1 [Cryptotermes secundus]|uniref:ATP-binding cassette sub-family G member 1 n=2 Tax=Cryptotermes secundus TaxID=105785 RepID=A0A2J7R9W6_9NEOP|nr:ATP-binding cassette sub-family G member 4 isoform X2 [Cryptotermes secundus]XP_023703690.1 ATP-binding cassette sub-family G member 4 isoform X2 [Cryptotermes secundus]XP_023703691.1 ATP-binding cassette sub-family G member 4 isoform X2 [Cryptotermes secundus]PNF37623.1 ATP-binding cassette sub-family G member 1 [Cryptotermes secundus]PNF37624.1 ATP-binding cassette sub-family G member 1 [Cryptotermes secundus]PNF37625.1 ATP-binding cassette sub-family G member 1 [Cryptotermes secundus]
MDVEFKDLCYTVSPRRWSRNGLQKRVLKSVSGVFKSGELSAIMGPSGAGKSSLLNAVSGYRTLGVTGTLCTNGKPRDNHIFHKLSCYITQEDLLQPLLTAHEIMMVAAQLKLPSQISDARRLSTVEEILKNLGLFECKNTRTEMLSGGQKKRLSIALELINNPPVFFLDEPTSGLDDVTARQVLQLLRTLARQGRTIVCTIHQPSASLFQLFDHAYIVSQGLCVYQGTTHELVPFLSSAGFSCPTHYNPADFVIEVTDGEEKNIAVLSKAICNGKVSWTQTHLIPLKTQEYEKKNGGTTKQTDKQSLHFETTNIAALTASERKVDSSSESSLSDVHCPVMYRRISQVKNVSYPTSTWFQFWALFKRMMLQTSRSRVALQLQMFHHVACALMIGSVTYQNASDGNEMFKHVKFCMSVILFHSYTWCIAPVLLFPSEVKLMKKEHFNRWYGLNSFYMALTLSKIPVQILLSMIFLIIVYYMNGLPAEWYRFSLFSLTAITVCLVAEGLGLAIGSVFNVTNGCVVGPLVVAPFLGLAVYGFDFAEKISWTMNTLMKTSFMRCGVVALVLTTFGFDRPDLDCDDIYCHFKEPKVVLRMLDIDRSSFWAEIFILFGIMILFRSLCYIGLRMRVAT